MLHMTLILEDNIVITSCGPDQKWRTKLVDAFSGKTTEIVCTHEQIAAIAALGLGGEDLKCAGQLYQAAEPALIGVEPEVRPIP